MKHLIQLSCLFLAISFLSSCKKENNQKSSGDSLIGSWELRKASGMLTINYPAGNGTAYTFTETGYQYFNHGVLSKTGQYSITNDNTVSTEVGLVIPSGQYTQRLILDNDTVSPKVFFQVHNDTLSFVSGYFPLDGGSFRTFVKK